MSADTTPRDDRRLSSTGISGLDEVLAGGLARGSVYLLEGEPGTGKTTVALQFLLDGARQGEACLYITLSETERELRASALTHGWALDGIEVVELVPPESLLDPSQQQTLLYSSELELGETTQTALDVVERLRPARIVLDSLSEIRLLAQSSLRYRRQILAMKHFFNRHSSTVLLLDDLTTEPGDRSVHSTAHGVLRLEELAPDYGAQRRRLRVLKYRGQRFRGGYHDFDIRTGGVTVFPRLVSAEDRRTPQRTIASSGLAALDELLGGGLHRGTSTLLFGASGTGKTLLAMQFAHAALLRGEKVALFIFDEEVSYLTERTLQLGIDLPRFVTGGLLHLEQVDAAEVSPGEFSGKVRTLVGGGLSMLVIDSLNGYQAAMPAEQYLTQHIHALLQYLNRRGVSSFVTLAQHGLIGDVRTPVNATYLADTVILLRYFEAAGRVRRAISVMKKRSGPHEDSIREFRISEVGLTVGDPLINYRGIMFDGPEFMPEQADAGQTGTP